MPSRDPSSDTDPADEQLSLVPRARARRPGRPVRATTPKPLAVQLPVAQVMVDTSLAHLDRTFDYAVPEALSAGVQPGVRVRVRFAGTDVDGVVTGRSATSEHEGRLTPVSRLVSPVVVLTPEVASLVRAVADRYAGTFADVLRAAVPPRHARAEAAVVARATAAGAATSAAGTPPVAAPERGAEAATAWDAYQGGRALVARVGSHRVGAAGPRAVWTATPGEPWAQAMSELAWAAHRAGVGVLWLVPDARDRRERDHLGLREVLVGVARAVEAEGLLVRHHQGDGEDLRDVERRLPRDARLVAAELPVVVGVELADGPRQPLSLIHISEPTRPY